MTTFFVSVCDVLSESGDTGTNVDPSHPPRHQPTLLTKENINNSPSYKAISAFVGSLKHALGVYDN